jgi:hypothetical protein
MRCARQLIHSCCLIAATLMASFCVSLFKCVLLLDLPHSLVHSCWKPHDRQTAICSEAMLQSNQGAPSVATIMQAAREGTSSTGANPLATNSATAAQNPPTIATVAHPPQTFRHSDQHLHLSNNGQLQEGGAGHPTQCAMACSVYP